jgi:hypothetical protein
LGDFQACFQVIDFEYIGRNKGVQLIALFGVRQLYGAMISLIFAWILAELIVARLRLILVGS